MIEIEDVHKQFGGNVVLRGVSLVVRSGEVCVLLGPSGGGKSTLLRTINAMESFDRGRICIDGLALTPNGDQRREVSLIRRRVGMVFQQFHLFPHMTALQNVAQALRCVLKLPRHQAEADAEFQLRRVGLADKLRAWPATLSGGQQQRVAIARALAMNPQAILFDEPTSALDPRMTAEVVSVMQELAAAGQTMIVVTHSLELARRVATTVHVLDCGRIAESGSPDQVLNRPSTQVAHDLVSAAAGTHSS